MKILITGGAGCLGSNLVEHWLPNGHEILVIDNFATGKKEVLPPISGLTVIKGSIADKELVMNCFQQFQPTHVVHAAAAYKDPENWVEDCETNILGTIHLAKAASLHGIEKFINFQTALCYGKPIQTPIPITHPTSPFTSYGISKTAGEAYLINAGLPVVSLRLANICAPRLSIGPIPTFYKRLKLGQNCFCTDTVRDFLDISDFLSLIDRVTESVSVNGIFNVSSGEGHSIKEVFDIVAEHLSVCMSDIPILPAGIDDVSTVVLDPSHTTKMFNWKAKISFKQTIVRQLAWYDNYGVTDIYSHLLNLK